MQTTQWRIAAGVGAFVVVVGLVWFGVSVLYPVARDSSCNGVQLRSDINAPSEKAAGQPRIGAGSITASLRQALRGQQQVAVCRDFADPYVLEDGGTFYAYSTNSDGMHVPVLSSRGLFTTGARHDALPKLPAWSAQGFGRVWAPSVLHQGNQYVLYYTTGADEQRQCISRAVSPKPEGPFTDDTPGAMICPSPAGAIDPSPFVDANGRAVLLWKDEQTRAIVSQPLTADGLGLEGQPTTLITADQPWEAGVVEAPSMTVTDGTYLLFYSGNDWQTADYAVGYATCAAPTGPCTKAGDKPWIAQTADARGPGGVEVFADSAGKRWLVGHAWIGPDVGYPKGARDLFVLQLTGVNGQPVAS